MGQQGKRLSRDDVKRLLRLRIDGKSHREAAKALGCSKDTVTKYARDDVVEVLREFISERGTAGVFQPSP